jgi:hypothetical protein
MAQFKLDSKDEEGAYTLRAMLSLNSAPGARFSSLTLNIWLTDGTILAVFPDTVAGPATEAEISKDKSLQATVSTSLQAGGGPASATIGANITVARAEHLSFTRRTRGIIRGNGVWSTNAYWVMKEDSGPAAQDGLVKLKDLR